MDVTKKKILPKGALAIILHTCEFAEGNTWAKRITKQAIKVLGEKDEVGVLAYTEKGEDWIFKLTPAGEYEKLVVKINDAQIGDMPSFVNTMQMGLKELIASDAAAKHMIIISDGDPQPPSPGLLQQFIDANISISTVAINPHTGQDISGMRGIANLTKGRYYFPQDPNELPSIFIKESKTLKRSMVQNETITPENTGFPSDVLKGLGALPQLKGYVLTTPKPTAELLLRVPLKEEDQIDPILATGKHGLGNTAAFTSDLSPNWGADWVAWEQYRPFLKQLLVRISRVHKREHLRVIAYAAGSEGIVLVEDYHPDESFLQLEARVSGPEERAETIELKQIGPRRYRGTLPLWGRGRYQVMVTPRSGARSEERAHGGFIVPYSPEYLRFRSSPIVLDEIASKTGGQSLVQNKDEQPTRADWIANAIKQIYHTRRQPKQSSQPVFDWFLIALCFLVPADVALRRIQIDLYSLKGLLSFGKREGPSTATMGALLDRKKAVADDLKVARKEVPLPQQRPIAAAGPCALRSSRRSRRQNRPANRLHHQRPIKKPQRPGCWR